MSLAPPLALWEISEATASTFPSIAARWRAGCFFFSLLSVFRLALAESSRSTTQLSPWEEAAQWKAVLPNL